MGAQLLINQRQQFGRGGQTVFWGPRVRPPAPSTVADALLPGAPIHGRGDPLYDGTRLLYTLHVAATIHGRGDPLTVPLMTISLWQLVVGKQPLP